MRTTVDLPEATHRRVRELAALRGTSVSATLADLAALGLSSLDEPFRIEAHPVSGLPVVPRYLGRTVSVEEVSELIDEDN